MRHLSLLLSALLFSVFAQAASNANITTASCSGSQSFDLTNSASLSCSGDFSLIGGSIDSDTSITISAFGSLFIGNMTLNAPLIQLKTVTGVLSFGDGISMTSDSINVDVGNATSPRITLAPGAILSVAGRDTNIVASQPGDLTLSQPGNIDLSARVGIIQSYGGSLTLVSSVPEPDSFWAMLSGGLLLLAIGRVRRKN